MAIGNKDESRLGANVLYARDLITLRNGQDARGIEKRRLKPGDRLADGTLWTGNSRLDGLRRVQTDLEQKIAILKGKLDQVISQIRELEPIALDENDVNPAPSLGKPKPKPKKESAPKEPSLADELRGVE